MDSFNLDRFRAAQQGVFANALAELKAGRKRSHWMWFIFPQLRGLGRSETAQFYGLESRAEAEAYLADPILGPRLIAACEALLTHENLTAREILGSPDDMKLRSCATLFSTLPAAPKTFERLLARFFNAVADPRTLDRLTFPGPSNEDAGASND